MTYSFRPSAPFLCLSCEFVGTKHGYETVNEFRCNNLGFYAI